MNKKRKGLVAISIFLFLVSSGWIANEWNERNYSEKELLRLERFEIQGVDISNINNKIPFGSREYIRRVPT